MISANITSMSGFLLMGFSDIRELQILQAFLFLVMYLLTLAGNLIIIIITTLDQRLHSPMYYFLKHLSLLDLSIISVTVPQSIDNSLMDDGCISHGQCMLQVFFFTTFAWDEVAILTVMSYDRYVAICFPLPYDVIMDPNICKWAVIAIWLSGSISGILNTTTTFSITFCRAKIIHHFFCDVPQFMKLSCSNNYLGVFGVDAFLSVMAFICFISIGLSYIYIFSTVLRMPSAEGQSKAFSICLPHLFVVSFFISTGIFDFLKPTSHSPSDFDLMISIFYTVIPPSLNPIIYRLRNEAMKGAFRKLVLGGEFKKAFLSCH
ncbi:LOW QUALITY PROTEIN: olfactory receptor 14J1-like [Orycteropus afer afer]|uniref:LOW QUALITY PROTEIN: olfactory receptor 14J1-like n=1 Tax=Orycteropus afer afer TaxID=1230840 RepID=A0A8B7B505_ORYAF|nr:LOW QUALITY PROTEIN: olfactory receptor 14J1-like [Orycteropus afer afer]